MIHDGSMDMRYDDVVDALRTAYDGDAERREAMAKTPWKVAERAAFLGRLRDEGCSRLLEVGAGTGQDSAYFQGNGLNVVAVDLSPAMVAYCRRKGIEAHARDLMHLGFAPESFDAVYSVNCLLHVPNRDLPTVLDAIRAVIRPGGLFFLGVYGTTESGEGLLEGDEHEPPRFFSWRTDEQIQEFAGQLFDIVDFHVVALERLRFQSLTLRRDDRPHGG
jgi:SAM-dependent methyltransferase